MALIYAADLFCGGTSGGSHVAAAFDKPAIIIAWRSFTKRIRFPDPGPDVSSHSFLYPQHYFICAEDIAKNAVSPIERAIQSAVKETVELEYRRQRMARIVRGFVEQKARARNQIWTKRRVVVLPAI